MPQRMHVLRSARMRADGRITHSVTPARDRQLVTVCATLRRQRNFTIVVDLPVAVLAISLERSRRTARTSDQVAREKEAEEAARIRRATAADGGALGGARRPTG